jgi:hypothetical protein
VIRRLTLVTIVALAACASADDGAARADRPVCEVRFAAPSGFAPIETFEEPYPDHVGVRLGFRDADRRQFHVLAGIPGEIGEGLPPGGTLRLTEDRTGELVGRDPVWVVVWSEGDRCDPRAVIGDGFTRETFVAALEDAGLV